MSRLDDELAHLEKLVARHPGNAQLLLKLGRLHEARNAYPDAIGAYSRCVTVEQHNLDAWARTGYCLMQLFKLREALDTFLFVQQLDPRHLDAIYGEAICRETLGDHAKAIERLDYAISLAPDHTNLYTYRAYLRASHGADPALTLASYREWGARFADPLTARAPELKVDRTPGRRLRIGYVSGDLRDHAVAYFTEPVFARHDRRHFEVCVFASGPADKVTARIKPTVDRWFDVSTMNDEALAALIRRQKIDILVDLSGHTQGNRLFAFARRPAPVQATWLGFLYTTGMQAMDYRITDAGIDPPGAGNVAHSETLFRLKAMATYHPPADTPLALEPPMLSMGRPVFVSLNNLKKVTDHVLALWKRVLDEVPDAILILIGYERTQEEAIAQQLPRLEAAGLPLERLCILPRLALDGFMQLGLKADVALDTFPISGGTTTLHALWMGLPVVALGGGQAFQSASAATLEGLGFHELIAADEDAYVALAASLARDPERLATFRAGVRPHMQSWPLMDYDGFVRDLEAGYRLMWLNYVNGDKRYLDTTTPVEEAIAAATEHEALAA